MTLTAREKEIWMEAYDQGYKAAEKSWKNKLAQIRRLSNHFTESLKEIT